MLPGHTALASVTRRCPHLTHAQLMVIPLFPEVGRWIPFGAATSLLQLGPSYGFDGVFLSAPMGGLLLDGYTAAAAALALVVTPRRDVL